MSPNPRPPRAPRALVDEWDRRLAASGFVDIEHRRTGRLVGGVRQDRKQVGKGDAMRGAEYYRRAAQWTWSRVWPTRYDKMLWRAWAEGATLVDIAPRARRHFVTVWRRIHKEEQRCMSHPWDGGEPTGPLPLHAMELAEINAAVGVGRDAPQRRRDRRPGVLVQRARLA